jgi:hypothetical protein
MNYVPGDFWRICEVCGFKYRSTQTSKRWDGLIVCREDFETRHPQDFVRGLTDRQNVPDPRPEPAHIFVGPTEAIMDELGFNLQCEDGTYIMIEPA